VASISEWYNAFYEECIPCMKRGVHVASNTSVRTYNACAMQDERRFTPYHMHDNSGLHVYIPRHERVLVATIVVKQTRVISHCY
jgi:hypothetical protein